MLGSAFQFAVQGIIALTTALLVLALAAIGLVTTLVAELARVAADMLRALATIAQHIVKVLLVATLVVVVTWSLPAVWVAYGGDIPALLPAGVATLLPVAYATTFRPIWSGLTFAIVAAGLAGAILPALHPIALALIAGGARAVGVLHILDAMPGKPQEEAT